MTTDLDRLIEVVEAGTLTEHECLSNGTRLPMCASTWAAYCGSLDAAVALLEALLPGWRKRLNFIEFADGSVSVTVFGPLPKTASKWEFSPIYEGLSTTPARALLLATLRAYRSTRESRHEW